MTRKPISVVKSVLHRNCSTVDIPKNYKLVTDASNESTWCDYAPFGMYIIKFNAGVIRPYYESSIYRMHIQFSADGPDSAALLGTLDTSFLLCYGIAMFISGFVAERVSLRYFLTLGMLFSAIFTYLFGIAKTYGIHSMWYFVLVQALAGICQTTGWPGVVTVVGRWFGKSKRGMIFGIWNSHTSIGNILGTVIAGHYVEHDWAMSFIMPALLMGLAGFVMFLFLVDSPEIVGCQERETRRMSHGSYHSIEDGAHDSDDPEGAKYVEREEHSTVAVEDQEINHRTLTERTPMLNVVARSHATPAHNHEAIGFDSALRIPGVIEFSLCLFFSKLVSYTFLYWLPKYIESTSEYAWHKI